MGSARRSDGEKREITTPCQMRFGLDDLRQVRRATERWAARAGLRHERAEDFVIAVNEIASNAVRYGSPSARLLLWVTGDGTAVAEIRDEGRWPPGTTASPAGEERGGMGIPLARQVCDAVEIQAGHGGTAVVLRMRLEKQPFA